MSLFALSSCISVGVFAVGAMIEEEKAKKLTQDAAELEKNKKNDELLDPKDACTYFLYKRDTWLLSGVTNLIYDNKVYVGHSKSKVFIKLDSIRVGEHSFQSAPDSKREARLLLLPLKMYLIQVLPSQTHGQIAKKEMKVMTKYDIAKELKDPFFKTKFE